MTIEPFRGRHGRIMGRALCDGGCGATVEFIAVAVRRKGTPGPDRIDIPAALHRVNESGWRATAKKQTCKTCVTTKPEKPKEEPEMVQITTTQSMTPIRAGGVKLDPVTDVPQPTRDQKREIMLMLQEVYDPAAKRYTGAETDQTVANALGIARWGWVSTIREEFFGPAGNEAADLLAAEVSGALVRTETTLVLAQGRMGEMGAMIEEVTIQRDKLAALLARVKGAK